MIEEIPHPDPWRRAFLVVPKTAKTLGSLDGAGSMVHDAPGEVPGPNRPGGD